MLATKSKTELTTDIENLRFTMTRIFDAPRELVYKVYTDPKLVPQWWGPASHVTIVDKMDVRPGGVWRYVQRDDDGTEYAFNGEYRQIMPNERIVQTFIFEPMPDHVIVEDITFEDVGGKTKLTSVSQSNSREAIEGMIASGMEKGAIETWDRLEALVAIQR